MSDQIKNKFVLFYLEEETKTTFFSVFDMLIRAGEILSFKIQSQALSNDSSTILDHSVIKQTSTKTTKVRDLKRVHHHQLIIRCI